MSLLYSSSYDKRSRRRGDCWIRDDYVVCCLLQDRDKKTEQLLTVTNIDQARSRITRFFRTGM